MAEQRYTTSSEDVPGFDPGFDPPAPEWDDGLGAGPPPPPQARGRIDLRALFVLLDAFRTAVPREMQGQLTGLIRELLLTLRALIDWYLDRLDGKSRRAEVEDIPID